MPQIASLPTTEPVDLAKAKPAIFGSGYEAVAELGQESEQLAQGSQEFAGRLLYAHRQLQLKQSEIAIDQYMNQVHADLQKQTSIEGVDEVVNDAQNPDKVGSLLKPYQKDPRVGQAVQLAWQQAQVDLQREVNNRKAGIITVGTKEADALNAKKTNTQAVAVAMAGGDDTDVSVFRDRYELGLHSGQAAGVYHPEEIPLLMDEWNQGFMKDLAKAEMDSPNSSMRKKAISDLKAGSGHFAGLDQTTRNALFDEAERKDRELTNLAESEDFSTAINRFDDLTQGWSYEKKVEALSNKDWLQKNFPDEQGQPDRKKADMLSSEVDKQEARQHKVQTDKDEQALEKYSPMIDAHQLSIPQIDRLLKSPANPEGISERAGNALKGQFYRNVREDRAELTAERAVAADERRQKRDELEDRSQQTSLNYWQQIDKGNVIDITSVYEDVGKGNLTKSQASTIVEGYHKSRQSADFANGLAVIDASTLDVATKAKLHDTFTKQVKEQSTKPEHMADAAQKLVDEAGKGATGSFINRLWDSIKSGHPGGTAPVSAIPTAEPAKIYARDPQGKLHEAESGTPLPDGWKLEDK